MIKASVCKLEIWPHKIHRNGLASDEVILVEVTMAT